MSMMDGASGSGKEPTVSYSVKELMADVRGRLDTLTQVLMSLATKEEMNELTRRVDDLEEKELTRALADAKHEEEKSDKREWRRWVIPVIIAAVSLVILLVTLFHAPTVNNHALVMLRHMVFTV